jgi:hypothetical protein
MQNELFYHGAFVKPRIAANRLAAYACLGAPPLMLAIFRLLCYSVVPSLIVDAFHRGANVFDRYQSLSWWRSTLFDSYFRTLEIYAIALSLFTIAMLLPRVRKKLNHIARYWQVLLVVDWIVILFQLGTPVFV